MNSYWFAARPNGEHRHPFLVFDCPDRLHVPLTLFGKEASVRVSPKTVQTYLYAIIPFFTYLDTDIWQQRAGLHWDDSPLHEYGKPLKSTWSRSSSAKCIHTGMAGSMSRSPPAHGVACGSFWPR